MGEGDGELLKRWATLESRVSSLGALVRGVGPAGALLEGVRHLKANLRAVERALPSPAAPELVVLDGEAPPPKRQRGIQSEAQGEVICIDGDEGAASTADCPVCLCPYESHELRVFSCGHWLCHECALRYVSAAVAEGKLLLHLAVCPSPGCDYKFAWDKGNRKLQCPLCSQSYCLVCQLSPWHTGVRCEARTGQGADDAFAAYAAAKGKKLKACPSCRAFVEKVSGCDHISCRCGAHWCFRCSGDLSTKWGCECMQRAARGYAGGGRGMAGHLANLAAHGHRLGQ